MKAFRKAHGLGDGRGLFDQLATEITEDTEGKTKKAQKTKSKKSRPPSDSVGFSSVSSVISVANSLPPADLAWHVRAWGQWVLAQARKELARFYFYCVISV